MKVALENMKMNECGFILTKLYLQKWVTSKIGRRNSWYFQIVSIISISNILKTEYNLKENYTSGLESLN